MTKQTKANKVVETKKTTKKQDTKIVEQKKSYRVPKCSVNFVVIEKFEDEMATLKLNRDSKVNDIMLASYAKHSTDLNPNVLANQIAKFKNVDKTKEDKVNALPSSQKQAKLDDALDSIRKRYGANAIMRGSLLPPKKD